MEWSQSFTPLVRRIQFVIDNPDCYEHWNSRVREWAKYHVLLPDCEGVEIPIVENGQTRIITRDYQRIHNLLPARPTLPYKYAILAAMNNWVCRLLDDKTMVKFSPWEPAQGSTPDRKLVDNKEASLELSMKTLSFDVLVTQVIDIAEQDIDLLDHYFDDICKDIEANVESAELGETELGAARLGAAAEEAQLENERPTPPPVDEIAVHDLSQTKKLVIKTVWNLQATHDGNCVSAGKIAETLGVVADTRIRNELAALRDLNLLGGKKGARGYWLTDAGVRAAKTVSQ
jgi:hypothetical protein